MARTLSRGLGPVVERLELDRPEVVTLRDIEGICGEEGIGTEPRVVVSRLKKAGWLIWLAISGHDRALRRKGLSVLDTCGIGAFA